ncbi:MAG: Uncharacterised protein [SAR116 cluster bacterium]|nr:MAG: Uncharacterised protein [SAR116 cluster bacterium]
MIGMVLHNHPAMTGIGARKAQGQLIRLGPGRHKIAMCQMRWQALPQRIGKLYLCGMQIARVRVDQPRLPRRHGVDPRMGVPDMRHIVVSIQICAAHLVIEIMFPTP